MASPIKHSSISILFRYGIADVGADLLAILSGKLAVFERAFESLLARDACL